jgi:hypothetical protein
LDHTRVDLHRDLVLAILGVEVRWPVLAIKPDGKQARDFARALQSSPHAPRAEATTADGMCIGWYGGGLASAPLSDRAARGTAVPAVNDLHIGETPMPRPNHPSPARPPFETELATLREQLLALRTPLAPGDAAFLGEDWCTQGDWVGRYGRSAGRRSSTSRWGATTASTRRSTGCSWTA